MKKLKNSNQVIKPRAWEISRDCSKNRTVYYGLENIDFEFYPRKNSVPDTENDETENTSQFEANKTETTNNLKPKTWERKHNDSSLKIKN